ncbi:hypothetical protein GJR96_11125 [Haloferax sp. MBLA0076]|uniref:PFL domain-containing protein n=1 Tax=Haloferax litoreum TaxID=2666140 RepID=A0A6A8GH54_9EURY|nr:MULTISPECIES: hypothetical protein [Haloferax]KAB1193957.1 hypothetical protein Hfx1148_11080 [Haloferax sp. CBA1148]MRX22503.1 hypothetical protein [Haloferax litoreum]
MAEFPDERQIVLRARSQLDQWTRDARREAYAELFEGDRPILTEAELRLLDALDSELEREGGDGVWGTDQYGIHTAGTSSSDTSLGVVCVYHPQITKDSVLRGRDELDDETEERLNAALWRYSERVATLIEAKLDEFIRRTQQ